MINGFWCIDMKLSVYSLLVEAKDYFFKLFFYPIMFTLVAVFVMFVFKMFSFTYTYFSFFIIFVVYNFLFFWKLGTRTKRFYEGDE